MERLRVSDAVRASVARRGTGARLRDALIPLHEDRTELEYLVIVGARR